MERNDCMCPSPPERPEETAHVYGTPEWTSHLSIGRWLVDKPPVHRQMACGGGWHGGRAEASFDQLALLINATKEILSKKAILTSCIMLQMSSLSTKE